MIHYTLLATSYVSPALGFRVLLYRDEGVDGFGIPLVVTAYYLEELAATLLADVFAYDLMVLNLLSLECQRVRIDLLPLSEKGVSSA